MVGIFKGGSPITDLRLGGAPIASVYLGSTKVWPATPLVITDKRLTGHNTNNPKTISGASIGAAAANRSVFVLTTEVCDNNTTANISSVVIGGVSATRAAFINFSATNIGIALWHALVPSGTTADINITRSYSGAAWSANLIVFTIPGVELPAYLDGAAVTSATGISSPSKSVSAGNRILLAGAVTVYTSASAPAATYVSLPSGMSLAGQTANANIPTRKNVVALGAYYLPPAGSYTANASFAATTPDDAGCFLVSIKLL